MKFHESRTAVRGPISGSDAYREAARAGRLDEVLVPLSLEEAVPGLWKRIGLANVAFRDSDAAQPLEVTTIALRPRALVIDELTRHSSTHQVFIPVNAGFVAIACGTRADDPDSPDSTACYAVPVRPGEAFVVERGTWHTLPFVLAEATTTLSVMHREDLDGYHDVRDLTASGWIASLALEDPLEV